MCLVASKRLLAGGLFGDVAGDQFVLQPIEDFRRNDEFPQLVRELTLQNFFACVPIRALPAVTRAVIVHVAPLFDLTHQTAPTVPTGDQTREHKVVFDPAVLLRMPSIEDFLAAFPNFARCQRLMRPVVGRTAIVELATVDAPTQDFVQSRNGNPISALAQPETFCISFLRERLQGIFTGGEPGKELAHHRSKNRVGHDDPLPIGTIGIQVSRRCIRRPQVLRRFGAQPFLDFLRKVINVVLGHQDLDSMDEFLRGPRVLAQDLVLLDEVDFHVQLVNDLPILDIPVEPVRLLHQQHLTVAVLAEVREHRGKSRSTGRLGRLRVHELLRDDESLRTSIGPQQLLLRRNTVALLLLLTGDPGVQDGLPRLGRDGIAKTAIQYIDVGWHMITRLPN